MAKSAYITKSSYVQGLTCEKWLWLGFHDPAPYEPPKPGSPAAVGTEVGIHAQKLFPGGALVDTKPWEHEEALEQTQDLMSDQSVAAIFEATFEHQGIRVRVDILERFDNNTWGIREVKSTTRVKEEYIHDIGLQAFVLQGCGIEVNSTELVLVDTSYIRGADGIDWQAYFTRQDVTEDVGAIFDGIKENALAMLRVLDQQKPPAIDPGKHCSKYCPFWNSCTAQKPNDWIFKLPRITADQLNSLKALKIDAIKDIPEDFPLKKTQERMRQGILTGKTWISPGLQQSLKSFGPPAFYLDFETISPAVPLYSGTRPYQRQPFQWSLHHLDGVDNLTHQGFLGDGTTDARREFTERLLEAVGGSNDPIIVYSSFEQSVLREMAAIFPEHAGPLKYVIDRIVDLLPITRSYVYHPSFMGSFSIKSVGPALAPSISYDKLNGIAGGTEAAAAFERMAAGTLGSDASITELRKQLLSYCELDTLAMVEVHRSLNQLSDSSDKLRG